MKVGIVDIGIGNIGSLRNALFSQGWDCELISTTESLSNISHLILPGVGSFSSAMKCLHQFKLIKPIQDFALSGRPILGICLGMQLLSSRGNEGGDVDGLGLISGYVTPIISKELRLPHVGWNNSIKLRNHPILENIRTDIDFYFVHSYRFSAIDEAVVIAESEYGERFPSIVGKGNVVGVQFHPEKSQANGLRLLDNFCLWNGIC